MTQYRWKAGQKGHPPELVGGHLAQLVEFDLLGEDIKRHIDGTPQPTTALVVVKDGVEARPVAVEEVLIPQGVKVTYAASRVAQQRVRKLVESAELGLEPQATHLHNGYTILVLNIQF